MAEDGQGDDSGDDRRQIVVAAYPLTGVLAGLVPDDELDEFGIAAFGLDNVGELIGEITPFVDRYGEGPVILVNGQPVSSIDEVSDLPVEALVKVQLLPREAAPRLGQSPRRRIINIVLKPSHRQWTAEAERRQSLAGKGYQAEGSLNYFRSQSSNRESITAKVRRVEPLFESDRPILSREEGSDYDLLGNVLAYPSNGGEIDPALSLLAGVPVTIAGVPTGVANPTLADFAATANRPNNTGIGDLRTLIAAQNVYTVNANLTRKLGDVSRFTLNGRLDFSENDALNGPSAAELRIPAASPFSPFGESVTLARYVGSLGNSSNARTASIGSSFNTRFDTWQLTILGNADFRSHHRISDRRIDTAALQEGIDDGTVNPFGPLPDDMLRPILSDTRYYSDSQRLQATLSGTILPLPAGELGLTVKGEYRRDHSRSQSQSANSTSDSRLTRREWNLMGELAIPVFAEGEGPGMLDLDLYGEIRDLTAFGTLFEFGGSLVWTPLPEIEVRVELRRERQAPSPNLLTDPVEIEPNHRVYDFLNGETVLVDLLTGGNPALAVERQGQFTAGITVTPLADLGLSFSAEYDHTTNRDILANLPSPSAEVQAAFPDRFQRDEFGTLVLLDDRSVTFARETEDELRWGFELKQTLGGTRGSAGGGASESDEDDGPAAPLSSAARALRINARLLHRWTLTSERQAREGLPVIDLLDGGATGYGTGKPAHLVDFAAGFGGRGFGLQFNGQWRGGSTIRANVASGPSDLHFAPYAQVNLRAFVNLSALAPRSGLAKGARVTVSVFNLLDARQEVTDGTGATPRNYQPFLVDPLGRTISRSLRKVF